MEKFVSPDYMWFWALILVGALFYPVRQLVWVLQVRRAERDGNEDSERRDQLKRRATVTSLLLCIVFSFFYTSHLFSGAP
jgi:hypothetical protein